MAVKLGVLVTLTAHPGKERELQKFLDGGRAIVDHEPGTQVWYAFKVDEQTYGIFDAFDSEEDRQAHLTGRIPDALAKVAPDLLAVPPDIRLFDVVAAK